MSSSDLPAPGEHPQTPFHDLDHYLTIPRISGLAMSPDGRRLVTTVATLDDKDTEYRSALWEIDPAGTRPARRLTRSAKGETGAVFAADGTLYFISERPDPEKPDPDPVKALWAVPSDGGEARLALSRAGGISGLLAAREANAVFVTAPVLAGSTDEGDDEARRKARKDKKVAAILHTGYPVRYWDADLGPGQPRLFAVEAAPGDGPGRPGTVDAVPPATLRNLTPDAGNGLREADVVVSPDGKTLYSSFVRPLADADSRTVLVAVDVASGTTRVLLDTAGMSYFPGPVSPDGRTLAVLSETDTTPERAPEVRLHLLDLAADDGALAPLAEGWDRWPHPAAWLPDGSALLVTADEDGASPVFRIDVATPAASNPAGEPVRLTSDAAAYSAVVVSPDGRSAYALRSAYEFPAEAVRIDLAGGGVTRLPAPAERPAYRGRLERVETTTGPAGGRLRGQTRSAPALDPRWSAGLLERLDLALEPLAAGGPRLRGAPAGPGAVHRLRPGTHPARLGRMGQGSLHGPDGDHRRGRAPHRHR